MTNLSERICKICGIEPRYVIRQFGKSALIYSTKEIAFQCIQRDFPEINTEAFLEKYGKYAFPDFETNANNFVRFQEILYKNGCDIRFYGASDYENSKLIAVSLVTDSWSDCAEDFKTALLRVSAKFLKGFEDIECYYEDKLREQLKQAIRQEQWEV